MRPARVYLAAAGPSAWIGIDRLQSSFAVGFRCTVEGGASLTYKVQHGFSDGIPVGGIAMTRSTTTATMTWPGVTPAILDAGHGMQSGDCIVNIGYGAPFDGTYTVTVSSSTVLTFTVANSGLTASNAGTTQRIYVGDNSVVTAETTSQDGNYAFPPSMIRSYITSYSSGALTLSVNQGLGV